MQNSSTSRDRRSSPQFEHPNVSSIGGARTSRTTSSRGRTPTTTVYGGTSSSGGSARGERRGKSSSSSCTSKKEQKIPPPSSSSSATTKSGSGRLAELSESDYFYLSFGKKVMSEDVRQRLLGRDAKSQFVLDPKAPIPSHSGGKIDDLYSWFDHLDYDPRSIKERKDQRRLEKEEEERNKQNNTESLMQQKLIGLSSVMRAEMQIFVDYLLDFGSRKDTSATDNSKQLMDLNGQDTTLEGQEDAENQGVRRMFRTDQQSSSSRSVTPIAGGTPVKRRRKRSSSTVSASPTDNRTLQRLVEEGVLPSSQMYMQLRDCFEILDLDTSGTITMDELRRASFTLDRAETYNDKAFRNLDQNRSGSIDFLEMLRVFFPKATLRQLLKVNNLFGKPYEKYPGGIIPARDRLQPKDVIEIDERFQKCCRLEEERGLTGRKGSPTLPVRGAAQTTGGGGRRVVDGSVLQETEGVEVHQLGTGAHQKIQNIKNSVSFADRNSLVSSSNNNPQHSLNRHNTASSETVDLGNSPPTCQKKISADTLIEALKLQRRAEWVKGIFDNFDLDHDGRINLNEFTEMFKYSYPPFCGPRPGEEEVMSLAWLAKRRDLDPTTFQLPKLKIHVPQVSPHLLKHAKAPPPVDEDVRAKKRRLIQEREQLEASQSKSAALQVTSTIASPRVLSNLTPAWQDRVRRADSENGDHARRGSRRATETDPNALSKAKNFGIESIEGVQISDDFRYLLQSGVGQSVGGSATPRAGGTRPVTVDSLMETGRPLFISSALAEYATPRPPSNQNI